MQGYVGYEYQFIIVLRKYKRNNSAKVSNKGSESKRGTGCRNPELSSGEGVAIIPLRKSILERGRLYGIGSFFWCSRGWPPG